MLKPDEFYRGLREIEPGPLEELVRKALAEGHSPPAVLNEGLIAGMALIGREFKSRELWVPDVLLAARNMKHAVEILKPLFSQGAQRGKARILLGTVKGDIHDIGKNLVAIMMAGSGLDVVDLGVDIPSARFLAAAQESRAEILGLSALLTTTMMEMRKVIETVKGSSLEPKPHIIVGGAPLTESFAREIGADGYAPDAVTGVELALKLLGKK